MMNLMKQPKPGNKKGSNISNMLTIILVIIGAGAILGLIRPSFLTMDNFNVLANAFTITALVGLAQMIIIAAGGMNLAVGSMGGLAGITAGALMDKMGAPAALAVLAGICIGMLCGLVNGILINRAGSKGVSFFLVTLATSSVFGGIVQGITNANPFYKLDPGFLAIGQTTFIGMPLVMWIMIIVAVLVGLLFKYTGTGRRILAFGGNIRASELYGISIKRVVIVSNVLSGLIASIAAILLVARLGSAQPDIGSDWMLFSFAAPLIGGTRLTGGKVNVFGTVLGAVLLSMISNGLVHLNVDVFWMTLIQGVIILAAVAVERIRQINSENMQRKEHVAV
jgi:ribose transport system permease protein